MPTAVAERLAVFVVLVLCPACALAIVFRNAARRRANQKRMEEDAPVGRLVKILLMVAANTGDRASKIVFGEPCEPDCAKIPHAGSPNCPWGEEDRVRFLGTNPEDIQRERSVDKAGEAQFPVYFKIGTTYQGQSLLSWNLLFPIVQVIDQWNGKKVLKTSATPRCPSAEENEILLRDAGNPALSRFLMEFENGQRILVRVGFEKSYYLSMAIDYLPRCK